MSDRWTPPHTLTMLRNTAPRLMLELGELCTLGFNPYPHSTSLDFAYRRLHSVTDDRIASLLANE